MTDEIVVDVKTLLNYMVESLKKGAGFYGPVFYRMAAKSVVGFVAKKINDPNTPSAQTLEEARDYVLLNVEKYPDGFAAFHYGGAVATKALEGGSGAAIATSIRQSVKGIADKPSGKTASDDANTIEVYKKYLERVTSMHLATSKIILSGDQNSAVAKNADCHFSDACTAIAEEGIRAVGGGLECPVARGQAAGVEQATGCPHAWELSEFKPPNCTFRVFKV